MYDAEQSQITYTIQMPSTVLDNYVTALHVYFLFMQGPLSPCSLYGPTVDQGDKIDDNCLLPRDLDVGDWIIIEDAGAYQLQGASGFCGFNRRHVYHYVTDDKR